MNNTKEILEDMRKITMLTGEISSVHEASLKQWPYIAFDNVDTHEVKYDLTKDYTKEVGEGYVEFYIVTSDKNNPEDLNKRCEVLTQWTRDMFWNNIRVNVFINGDKVFEDSTLG